MDNKDFVPISLTVLHILLVRKSPSLFLGNLYKSKDCVSANLIEFEDSKQIPIGVHVEFHSFSVEKVIEYLSTVLAYL